MFQKPSTESTSWKLTSLVWRVANIVEHEELGLAAEIGGVSEPGRLEVRLGALRDAARVAGIARTGAGS